MTYGDGTIREMVLWQFPRKAAEELHGLKYCLYYGLPDGTCLVRYDNEAGKNLMSSKMWRLWSQTSWRTLKRLGGNGDEKRNTDWGL
jgi:hypothetical protein